MKEVITLSEQDLEKVREAARIIASNLKYRHKADELTTKLLINRNKLNQGFQKLYGDTPYDYLLQQRLEKAKSLLLTDTELHSIGLQIGFSGKQAKTNFIRFFKREIGITPTAWRQNREEQARIEKSRKLSA